MLILGLDVVTLAMGLPVVFVLGTVSMAYLYRQDLPFILLAQRVFVGMDSFVLLAIPCYVLMGNVMSHGLVTDILVKRAKTMVGRIRGGLAAATVNVEIIFFRDLRVGVGRCLSPRKRFDSGHGKGRIR